MYIIFFTTGLMRHDITYTLQSLNMVVEHNEKLTICIDWNVVNAHMKKINSSKYIVIEPECLRWTPLMPASNILISPDGKVCLYNIEFYVYAFFLKFLINKFHLRKTKNSKNLLQSKLKSSKVQSRRNDVREECQ